MSGARIGFPTGATGGTTAQGRLGSALSNLRRDHEKRSNTGKRARRRGNRLRADQSRTRETRPALGKADWYSDRGTSLLLHLRTATIDLQSIHGRDRDFLHAFAE